MRNHGYSYVSAIGGEGRGRSVVVYLAEEYRHSSAEEWQECLDRGEVTLDGVRAAGPEIVQAGQTLLWRRPPWIEPDAPRHFDVLFEDSDLLAVNKPSGLPTLPGGGFMENTLLHLVQRRNPEANPLHRLGRGTSGIVLFAKTAQAAARLAKDWNTARVRKTYRALAGQEAARDEYEITTPIGLAPHPRIASVWAANPAGKAAKSVARVLERSGGNTTFAVTLHTGRPHQIRIHLASIGHPLVGDPLYGMGGTPLEELPGLPGDGGYLLHAQYLEFDHPLSGERIQLEAPLPPRWLEVLSGS